MRRSEYNIGEFLYGIPDSEESAKYNPENQRVFIHDGYVNGDGYGKVIGWHDGEIKKSTGYGNFCWGAGVRKATDDEIESFIKSIHRQECIKPYWNSSPCFGGERIKNKAMNREIKFRGRIVNSKEWVYGSLVVYPDGEYNIFAPRNGHPSKMDDWLVEVDTIGQFTGLYDKNGREIYEGDIIDILCDSGFVKGFIEWNKEMGLYGIHLKYDNDCGFTPLGKMIFYYVVCVTGNIHDNPELIKKK